METGVVGERLGLLAHRIVSLPLPNLFPTPSAPVKITLRGELARMVCETRSADCNSCETGAPLRGAWVATNKRKSSLFSRTLSLCADNCMIRRVIGTHRCGFHDSRLACDLGHACVRNHFPRTIRLDKRKGLQQRQQCNATMRGIRCLPGAKYCR